MNKSEMVEAIAKQADLPKTKAEAALKAFIETTKKTLKKGGEVQLIGFGTFCVAKRSARRVAIPRPAKPSRLRLPSCPSSSRARPSRMPSNLP